MAWTFFGSSSKESAFGRMAFAATRIEEAKGKIVSLQDSLKAKRVTVGELRTQAEAIHTDQDTLDQEIVDLHALLG